MIDRQLTKVIQKHLISSRKAIVLIGPRQTGKTTLLKDLISQDKGFLFLDGDDPQTRNELAEINTSKLRQLVGDNQIVFVDEAQRIPGIGITLKLITDQMPEVQLFVSGSSAFEINQQVNEPLTGRKWEYNLFPITWKELEGQLGYLKSKQQLEQRLIYGMYPEVVTNLGMEEKVLKQLTSSYLYKDVLSIAGIRKPEFVEKLLKALAFQVGNEVSYNELSNLVGIDKNTISTYIDILEKTYVIFRLQPFSRNLRNEISTKRKIYFYDNGLRNTLISNFGSLEYRSDKGQLWENFLISERHKQNHYQDRVVNTYYWRTKQQQEIDFVEEANGQLKAFEFKFSDKKRVKLPITFEKAYPNTDFEVVNSENFQAFVG
ncbi:MAG: ATP-binding protein [Cyclobacteriaceae bacterium]